MAIRYSSSNDDKSKFVHEKNRCFAFPLRLTTFMLAFKPYPMSKPGEIQAYMLVCVVLYWILKKDALTDFTKMTTTAKPKFKPFLPYKNGGKIKVIFYKNKTFMLKKVVVLFLKIVKLKSLPAIFTWHSWLGIWLF